MTSAFTVRVPATSANLGPGFDTLGLALTLYDEVSAEATSSPTEVRISGEGAGELPTDEKHLIVQAMAETFGELGLPVMNVRLNCLNRIPQARGLGSSSAAIVAGVTLANALAQGGLNRAQLLQIAARIEGHPDNVASCLMGGFTIAWMRDGLARAVSMEPTTLLAATLLVPDNRGLTKHARAALPPAVPHEDAAYNAARAALLVRALTHDPELLFEATDDRLHQVYRASGMPETVAMVNRLRVGGAAAMVSGAGPSVLVLSALPSDFSPGQGWLAHRLTAQAGGVELYAGNICGTFGHAE